MFKQHLCEQHWIASLLSIAFLSIILLWPDGAQGQSNWKPGFVVKGGDTLQGLVLHHDHMQQLCHFKIADGESQVHKPNDISSWGFEAGSVYRSVDLLLPKDTLPLFGLLMAEGYTTLLRYDGLDQEQKRYILCNGANECHQINDPKQLDDALQFKGRLNYLLGNQQGIREKIYRMPISEEYLTALINQYNAVMAVEQGEELRIEKTSFRFLIRTGLSLSDMSFVPATYHNVDDNYNKSTAPLIGIAAEALPAVFESKFGFRLGSILQKTSYSGQEVSFNSTSLRIPIEGVFHFKQVVKGLEISAGFYSRILLNTSQKGTYIFDPQSNLASFDDEKITFPKKDTHFGLTAGLGYNIPLRKRTALWLALAASKDWGSVLFNYYGSYRGFYKWNESHISATSLFLDLQLGLIF